jgi:DNA-binding IclR family transcriptional regulator
MATTSTPAKASSVEAILEALGQHPQATTTELAQAAGVGRSTAAKTLATLEGQGRVARRRGTPEGGKPTPDRWTLGADPLAGRAGRAEPEPPPPEEASGGGPATASKTPAEADPDQPDGQATGGRLRAGALRSLVHDWLAERPDQEFTPTRIGKELGRSAGAVGNALATMTDQGDVAQTSHKPRRYAIAEGRGHAGATR